MPSLLLGYHLFAEHGARSVFLPVLIEDLFSRKIVGDEVHEQESGELASELLQRTLLREGCLHSGVVLHSDNGAPMKSQTMRAKAYELGVTTS